jgi:arylsulfatase A-like enzyme
MISAACQRPPARPPDVILITIDTLRADHLGFYGYRRDTSPSLDALARDGTAFARCYTQSVTTRASHATIFTGSLPRTHGVLSNFVQFTDRPTLMSALKARGYATAAFVSSVVLNAKSGASRYVDHFDDALTSVEVNRTAMFERPARDSLHAARAYLARLPRKRPFFAWIHLIDPHGPYTAPENPDRFVGDAYAKPGRRLLPLGRGSKVFRAIPAYQILNGIQDPDYYVARYDGEIRYADDALGEFFADLKSLGLYDGALIVVTADHGETLEEPTHRRYFSHGYIAYEEVSRVPLIMHEPGRGRRLATLDAAQPVMTMDIAPTILDLAGAEIPNAFEGRSLLAGARTADAAIYSLGAYGLPRIERIVGTQFSVLRGPWRYIMNSLDGGEELYDHRGDAGETQNLAPSAPPVLGELRREIQDYLASPSARGRTSDVSPKERERLKALGYVN